MRATFCLLFAISMVGCSSVPQKVAPYYPPGDNASQAEWDAYAAAKRDGPVEGSNYPAWTGPASVLAKLATGAVSFTH
jgi:hypothetical protein